MPNGRKPGAAARVLRQIIYLAVLAAGTVNTSRAQRTQENATDQADDAFGTTVGRDTIGLYSPTSARGFSPSQAGNLRIDGLYFDNVAEPPPTTRIVRDSVVHVGLSTHDYPFPAPTGVVDFHLRQPGSSPGAALILGGDALQQKYVEFDGTMPVSAARIAGGLGYTDNSAYSTASGSSDLSAGTIIAYDADRGFRVRGFWGADSHSESGERPVVFIGSAGYPKFRSPALPVQPWTGFKSLQTAGGLILEQELSSSIELRGALFHSSFGVSRNQEPMLLDTNADGVGNYQISVSPSSSSRSTSGELRAVYHSSGTRIRQEAGFQLRGYIRHVESGGAEQRQFGLGSTRWVPQVARFGPASPPTTVVESTQFTPGIYYKVQSSRVTLEAGLSAPQYARAAVESLASKRSNSQPLLSHAAAEVHLGAMAELYGSATSGLEEFGTAPDNARNRGESAPAARTSQFEIGTRIRVLSRFQLLASVFSITKPNFALDEANDYRRLGQASNRGIELSLTGALSPRLTVLIGTSLIRGIVTQDGGGSTATAVGPIPVLGKADIQYRLGRMPDISVEGRLEYVSARYARFPTVGLPAALTASFGIRYSAKIWGRSTLLKILGTNLTNQYELLPQKSGKLTLLDGRNVDISLAVDF